jgi:hypothetical protein
MANDIFSSLRSIEAEGEAKRYCKHCREAKLSIHFVDDKCAECRNPAPIMEIDELSSLIAFCKKTAIMQLIRNHRAEFDALLTIEKEKAGILNPNKPDTSGWMEMFRSAHRKKNQEAYHASKSN